MWGHVRLLIALLAFSFFGVPNVYTNYIDTKTPIVIQNVDGENNSFGYSLAFMKGYFGEASAGREAKEITLFIGAPNETQLTKKSGVVWQCRFDGSERATPLCSILDQISGGKSNPSGAQNIQSKNFKETSANQWIGGSLSVSGRKLYVGAPRGKEGSSETADRMRGGCYEVSNSISFQDLRPLDTKDDKFWDYVKEVTVRRQWFQYAQFGFSVHTDPSGYLFGGAPGIRNWRGAVVKMQNNNQKHENIYNEHGENSKVNKYSYLGYSVTSGRMHKGNSYTATGAPRGANLYGMVTVLPSWQSDAYIYEGEKMGSYFGYALGTVDLNGDGSDELLVGAPFYTFDPLSPSAQNTGCVFIFYINLHSSIRPRDRLCPNSGDSTVGVTMGARFGSAICKLGDINHDSIDDFAVSAPYDDGGVGTLFIYLGSRTFAGAPSQIIRGRTLGIPDLRGWGTHLLHGGHHDVDGNTTPDLVAAAFESRHVTVLRSRPGAKVDVNITFHQVDRNVFGKEILTLSPNPDRFGVRICVRFQLLVRSPPKIELKAWLKFEADPMENRLNITQPRTGLKNLIDVSSWEVKCLDYHLKVNRHVAEQKSDDPFEFQVKLQYNDTALSDGQPATPTVFSLSGFNSQSHQAKQARVFNPYWPVPFEKESRAEIFSDNCNADKRPECDPSLKLQLTVFYLNSNAKNQQTWKPGQPLVVGQLESLLISVAVSNHNETAKLPTCRITFSVTSANIEVNLPYLNMNWLKNTGVSGNCYDPFETDEKKYEGKRVSHRRCPKSLHAGNTTNYLFSISNLTSFLVNADKGTGDMVLKVDAFPALNETFHKISEIMKVPLVGSVKISVETGNDKTSQSGINPKQVSMVNLTQIYLVKNTGFSATVANIVTVKVLVPGYATITNGNGTRVTQVIGVTDPTNSIVKCQPLNFQFLKSPTHGEIMTNDSGSPTTIATADNQLILATPPGSPTSKTSKPTSVIVSESSEDKYITFSGCDAPEKVSIQQACQEIMCKMDLPSKGSREIKIQLHLLSAAIENLITEKTKGVRVQTIFSVSIPEIASPVLSTGIVQISFTNTVGRAALWIYLVAIAGGIIVYLLIAYGMFRCGFFRREKKESLLLLKRQTLQPNDTDAWSFLAEADDDEAD